MAQKKPLIVAGIPALNEEVTIAKVVIVAQRHADKIVVCDDGSDDMTGDIAKALGAEVIAHQRNLGYGATIGSLFEMAIRLGADVLVTLDGDGQHNPDSIPELVAPLRSGEADIVIGSRFIGKNSQIPKSREAGIKVLTGLSGRIAYEGVTDAQSGYRAYNRKALEAVRPTEMGMGASTEILSKAKEAELRVKEVPIEVRYTKDSSTHNPVFHAADVALSTVKHLSIRHPLMFYGGPGFASLLIAIGFWWWTFSLYVAEKRLVTNVALIAVAATMVGLILAAVAVILWVMVSVIRERSGSTVVA